MKWIDESSEVMRIRKKSRSCISLLIITAMAFLLAVTVTPRSQVQAASLGSGHIVCSENGLVAARSGPGTNYEIMHNLANGKEIEVLEEVKGADGMTWYKISYRLIVNNAECISYVRSDYATYTPGSGSSSSGSSSTDSSASTGAAYATGTIKGMSVAVRNAAGTSGTTVLVYLDTGHSVSIIGETMVNGTIWYNVTGVKNGSSFTGWTISTYLSVLYNNVSDSDYAQSLRNAGFPESYINNLVALHAKYPNWVFTPVNTGLDWNTVISNESKNGLNLVENSVNDARKSTASGAYDWNTNTWTIYDSGRWVGASRNYIAYCMDPRNFLDESNIFQFESLSYNATQNLAGVQSILSGTFMSGSVTDTDGSTLNYAQTFVNVGKANGVSPYHLASRVKQEQGTNGTSALISGTYGNYKGYFNYFNYGATGRTSSAVIENGLKYAVAQGWNTRYKSINGGAKLLGANYINKGQDTLYTEKFNVTNTSALYSHQYMQNVTAAISEGQSVAKGYTDKSQAFVFKIPVYKNMPESRVTFSDSGNPNNYLKSLSISGVSLTPGFSGSNTSYSVVVGNAVSSISVSAQAVAGTSSISGTGNYNLSVGNNTIKVYCKSQSGDTRTYTINVSRQDSSGGNVSTDYTVSSSKYKVGSSITGISIGTTADNLKSGLSSNGKIKILKSDGSENTGTVGTGNKVAVYDNSGNLKSTYDIVVYGDANGDGKVSISDLIAVNRHILAKSSLRGVKFTAGDANKDGKISISDLILINNQILGKKTITQ